MKSSFWSYLRYSSSFLRFLHESLVGFILLEFLQELLLKPLLGFVPMFLCWELSRSSFQNSSRISFPDFSRSSSRISFPKFRPEFLLRFFLRSSSEGLPGFFFRDSSGSFFRNSTSSSRDYSRSSFRGALKVLSKIPPRLGKCLLTPFI